MKSSYITSHNAGYEILSHEIYSREFTQKDGMCYEYGIVIAHKHLSCSEEYVTWEYTTVSQDGNLLTRSFFWGHYYANKYSALMDYHERLSNYYRLHTVDFKGEE